MKSLYFALSASMATLATSAPADKVTEKRATPTVYLAGDSTMAKGGGGTSTEGLSRLSATFIPRLIDTLGWGVYLPYSLTIPVVNDAVAGRSARSYTVEGRFTTLANTVASGDFVIIEFGHNDGGSLTPTDNGRSDCVGAGSETCTTAAGVVVQTYPTYLTNAAKLMTAKGAHVIISSPTPDNTCESGTCTYTAPRFTGYGSIIVSNVGSMAAFVDHGQYLANQVRLLTWRMIPDFHGSLGPGAVSGFPVLENVSIFAPKTALGSEAPSQLLMFALANFSYSTKNWGSRR